jgi:uncharacterized membrane protein
MTHRRATWIAFSVIAATAVLGTWAWLRLPAAAVIAMHFDVRGTPTGFAPKTFGLFILPAIGAAVIGVLAAAPAILPGGKRLALSAEAYGTTMIGVAAVLLVSEGALIARAMDPAFEVLRWVAVAVGVLVVAIGNLLGKLRHNFVFGVRTPWTLANERVWDKTHRFTGRLMVASGVALAAASELLPRGALVALIVLAAAGPAVVGGLYSWRLRHTVS